MDLSEIIKAADAQDKGHAFELLDPVHGEPTGVKLIVAGPDSQIAKSAREVMAKEAARLEARRGGMTSADQTRLMEDYLSAVTIGWDAKEKGKAVPFSKDAFLTLLRAGTWVRAQVDGFAGDRSPYFKAEG
jgi:hypothetical protein